MSAEDIEDLALELSHVLYLRDRAVREYHFFKLDIEARRALAFPPGEDAPGDEPRRLTADQEASQAALAEFMATYDLPELAPRIPPQAARAYLAELKAGRVPGWAQKTIKIREIRASARRG